jgi:hypothetical protein
MVINYLHVVGVPVLPPKAYPPLIVDPDAVLPFSGPFEGFESIGGRDAEIV